MSRGVEKGGYGCEGWDMVGGKAAGRLDHEGALEERFLLKGFSTWRHRRRERWKLLFMLAFSFSSVLQQPAGKRGIHGYDRTQPSTHQWK